jgi:hypothetical protein
MNQKNAVFVECTFRFVGCRSRINTAIIVNGKPVKSELTLNGSKTEIKLAD